MAVATTTPNPPLTPAVFHILLALSSRERHGYGILKQVEVDSQGKVTMGAGTLYGSLKRMLDAGLVEESDKRVDPEMDDERRIYYQITGVGTQALAAELERYKHLVTLAQKRKLLPKTLRMAYDQETVRTLYKKLLSLYPRAFRERLGESMEQTFNDLCNERKRQTEQGVFGFVLWVFVETAIGIIKEQALRIKQGDTMKTIITNLRSAAIISFILVLPFMILEALNNTITKQNAPGLILLFGVLWILPTAFIVILMPIVRKVRAGNSILANPINLLFRVAFLALIATIWGWGFIDQLPCFLGVPNCD